MTYNNASKTAIFTQIREFLERTKMMYNSQYHVVLHTSFGKFVCDLEPFAESSSAVGFTDDPTFFSVDASAIFDQYSEFGTGMLNTRNVIVYNHKGEEHMRADQIILFTDQILGFSLMRKAK